MSPTDVLAAADENMRRAWRALLASAPEPGRVEDANLLLLSSGTDVPLLNPAFVIDEAPAARAMVRRVVEHYAALESPFALYFRDEVSPGVADACLSEGLIEHWRPALMVLEPIPPAGPEPPDDLAVTVLDADTAEAYAAVLAEVFGLPSDLADRILGPAVLEVEGFVGFLGLVAGQPVATSGLFVSGDVAGVYNVATGPAHRGRGLGAALTWAAVARGRAAGCTRSVLQASEQGEALYRRMGYRTPTRYRQFEPPR